MIQITQKAVNDVGLTADTILAVAEQKPQTTIGSGRSTIISSLIDVFTTVATDLRRRQLSKGNNTSQNQLQVD